jgi:ribose transport system substrate-binding protein
MMNLKSTVNQIFKKGKKFGIVAVASLIIFYGVLTPVGAAEITDTLRKPFQTALKGKTVAFVPLAMFDLTECWSRIFKQECDKYGINFVMKDPNWNTDAQAQAVAALIDEKPDVLIVHNNNVQLLAKLLKKAEKSGIRVLQINMASLYKTDVFVGADAVELGELAAKKIIEKCSKKKGKSGKIAIVQGQLTGAFSLYQMKGFFSVLDQHPGEIEVVANQAAQWDATKAKNIIETVMNQHSDLAGVYGIWTNMMIGAGEAIKTAGRADDICVVTNGGGTKMACQAVQDGVFDYVWSYDAPQQARDLMAAVKFLLQTDSKPGDFRVALYTRLKEISLENFNANDCWALEDCK